MMVPPQKKGLLIQSGYNLIPIAITLMVGCGSDLPIGIQSSTHLTEDKASFFTSLYRGNPLFKEAGSYSTLILGQDPADVYFPKLDRHDSPIRDEKEFPLALVLQGALVDKEFYSTYAETIARYGFVVVVPNRTKLFPALNLEGFFPDTSLIRDTLTQMEIENTRLDAPVKDLIDTETMVLLGHSFGGAVGLSALAGECQPFLCQEPLDLPEAVQGGAFYGTNRAQFNGTILPTPNHGFPIAIVAGSLDGVSTLEETITTYDLIRNSPKTLVVVKGSNHYGITTINNPPGSSPDPTDPTLDQTIATERIARWSALFLRAEILKDPQASRYLYRTGDRLDSVVTVTSERF